MLGARLQQGGASAPVPVAARVDFDAETARRLVPLLHAIWGKEPAT
jgi:hypothetical protein